jgi:hypothetical protein
MLWWLPSSGLLRRAAFVRADVPPKRRFLQESRGVTSQKTAFFIVTAVKTSNLTNLILYFYPRQIVSFSFTQTLWDCILNARHLPFKSSPTHCSLCTDIKPFGLNSAIIPEYEYLHLLGGGILNMQEVLLQLNSIVHLASHSPRGLL